MKALETKPRNLAPETLEILFVTNKWFKVNTIDHTEYQTGRNATRFAYQKNKNHSREQSAPRHSNQNRMIQIRYFLRPIEFRKTLLL